MSMFSELRPLFGEISAIWQRFQSNGETSTRRVFLNIQQCKQGEILLNAHNQILYMTKHLYRVMTRLELQI